MSDQWYNTCDMNTISLFYISKANEKEPSRESNQKEVNEIELELIIAFSFFLAINIAAMGAPSLPFRNKTSEVKLQ